jgi:hypothetical protein
MPLLHLTLSYLPALSVTVIGLIVADIILIVTLDNLSRSD